MHRSYAVARKICVLQFCGVVFGPVRSCMQARGDVRAGSLRNEKRNQTNALQRGGRVLGVEKRRQGLGFVAGADCNRTEPNGAVMPREFG
jgi:hypothetical protein